MQLLSSHGIFSASELRSRHDVLLEHYCKILSIEALTMIDMVKRDILPAISNYGKTLCDAYASQTAVLKGYTGGYEVSVAARLAELSDAVYRKITALEEKVPAVGRIADITERAGAYYKEILGAMEELRVLVDEAESLVASDNWPYPTYGDLLFGV